MKNIPISGRARISLTLIACLAVLFTAEAANASGYISDIKVSPDLKTLLIKFKGDPGKHTAFVMDNPYRLIVDFESTGLATIPRRIRIARTPIREIRLGSNSSRARVVVDFGANPAPTYKIHRKKGLVALVLDLELEPEPVRKPKRRSARKPKKKKHRPKPARTRVTNSDLNSPMKVTTAGTADNMIYLELVDKKDSNRRYRLVMEMDMNRIRVNQVSISDADGKVECFKVTPVRPAVASREAPPVKPEARPRAATASPKSALVNSGLRWRQLPLDERYFPKVFRETKPPPVPTPSRAKNRGPTVEG